MSELDSALGSSRGCASLWGYYNLFIRSYRLYSEVAFHECHPLPQSSNGHVRKAHHHDYRLPTKIRTHMIVIVCECWSKCSRHLSYGQSDAKRGSRRISAQSKPTRL